MITIAFGGMFTFVCCMLMLTYYPDSRLTDKTRKSLFRGEIQNEYQHPARTVHQH